MKEEIILKKGQKMVVLSQFEADLNTEIVGKKSAENTLANLRKKLEEKKILLEMLKNPGAVKSGQTNTLVDLAYSNKRKSLSPRKVTIENKEKIKKNKRIKSVSRRINIKMSK